MMKKQLKIWKDEFFRYYDRTSVMTRIIIGALLSFGTAYFLTQKVIKPQNAQLKALKQKFQNLEVIDDVEIQTADLKNKQRKAGMYLEGLKKANEKLALSMGSLSRDEVGKNILDLRFLMDKNSLRILSEERIIPVKQQRRRSSRVKQKADTRIKISFPSSMGCESSRFELLGSYQDLRRFFMDVRKAQNLFFINNICIRGSKETITDRSFKEHRALRCTFEVHIPYHKGAEKSAKKAEKRSVKK